MTRPEYLRLEHMARVSRSRGRWWRPKRGPVWTAGRWWHLGLGFMIPAAAWHHCGPDGLGFACWGMAFAAGLWELATVRLGRWMLWSHRYGDVVDFAAFLLGIVFAAAVFGRAPAAPP